MGLTRDTLEGSPEMSVETRGTVSLVRKAEPDSQTLPAEIANGWGLWLALRTSRGVPGCCRPLTLHRNFFLSYLSPRT